MATIAVDGLNEEDFRRSIENRLREGQAARAVERLRALLVGYAGPGRTLPERFLTVEPSDLVLSGWERLGDSLKRYDQPGRPVTALSIAFGWPGEELPQPDAAGRLRPCIETGYFTDDAYPFSQSGRDDLLDGYSRYGCTWASDCEATDTALALEGIDDLHGALAALEARLLASDEPDEEEILAGSLGACLLSALLFQAVEDRIARDGLPRPLCVTAGSSGVYPYFDAPVAGMSDAALKAAEAQAEIDAANAAVPVPRYSSLLMTGIPRAAKRAVLVLAETETETQTRIAKLRGLNHADEPAPVTPVPDNVITPAPGGPLLTTKKPHGQAWDFREMLGPREPDGPVGEAPLPEPVDWPEAPLPTIPDGPPVGPGFSLFESGVQDRLQYLMTAYESESAEEPVAEPLVVELSAPEDRPVHALRRGLLPAEEAGPAKPIRLARQEVDEPAPRIGLWARLRNWVTRLR